MADGDKLVNVKDSTKSEGKRPIAKERIYGTDAYGRRVLVAAAGQPIPEGFELDGPAQDHARTGPESSHGSSPRRRRARSSGE